MVTVCLILHLTSDENSEGSFPSDKEDCILALSTVSALSMFLIRSEITEFLSLSTLPKSMEKDIYDSCRISEVVKY